MSFKTHGNKTRPDRMKPPPQSPFQSIPSPTSSTPLPPSWSTSTPKPPSHSHSRRSSTSSTSSHSSSPLPFHDPHFPAAEEALMLSTSHTLKSAANTQFASQDYSSAIDTYDRALAELPSYLEYEMAVLQSNISACHLRLEQWKQAVDAAEKGLEGLEREWPSEEGRKMKEKERKEKSKTERRKGRDRTRTRKRDIDNTNRKNGANPNSLNSDTESDSDTFHDPAPNAANKPDLSSLPHDNAVVELPSDASDTEISAHLTALEISDSRRTDILRIRTKLLLRRARARSSLQPPSWTSLSGALADYTTLSANPAYFKILPLSDQRTIRTALRELPGRVDEAKQKEVGDMMGKLKELGNGLLKPFGLSTDMFKMVQDQGSGGWSMSFDQGGGADGGGGGGNSEKKEGAAQGGEEK